MEKFTRREVLKLLGMGAAGVVLGACTPEMPKQKPDLAPVLPVTPITRSSREEYMDKLTPEQKQVFLAHEKDAQNITREWVNTNRLEMLELVPEPSESFNFWALEEPSQNPKVPERKKVVRLGEGYNVTTNTLSYFKMSGSINKEIIKEYSERSRGSEDRFLALEGGIKRFLNVPDGLVWGRGMEGSSLVVSARGISHNQEIDLRASDRESGTFALMVIYR